MLRTGRFRLLKKPSFLLIVLGILFLVVTLRISLIPLPNNEIFVKMIGGLIPSTKRDWNDYKLMWKDARRIGLGEQGKAASLSDNVDRELKKNLTKKFSFNALLSDAISVQRSARDLRDGGCINKRYYAKLPTVSIIIPFYNEYFSVFMRTLHSVVNRTPNELLKEIILIDDFSSFKNLGKQLEQYVAEHFDKVHILRFSKHMGFIRARMAGARKATAEVLVFLDAHVEVNYNWLPPLLEPIVFNNHTVVCPVIDKIAHDNFEYRALRANRLGLRGGFDWEMRYQHFDILPEDLVDRTKPYKNPIMFGGLFAISAEYFWNLGAYDEGLEFWGGEQYELSFKIWMCGGQLLGAPCSRVAHLSTSSDHRLSGLDPLKYVLKNYKRIAEVWMDEYKHYVYKRYHGNLDKVDAGNLTTQKALRQRLNCKSFKWFMEKIALRKNPPFDPSDYAYGAIKNVGAPHLCVDTQNLTLKQKVGLYPCDPNIMSKPTDSQKFILSWRHELRNIGSFACLGAPKHQENASVLLLKCHHEGGDQFWYYERINKLLISGHDDAHKLCLVAAPRDNVLYLGTCRTNNPYMQWNFDVVNDLAIDEMGS